MKKIAVKDLQKMFTKTVDETAKKFVKDLKDHLDREHHRSGLLARSLKVTSDSDGASVYSDVPYAAFFEAQTGAVGDFAQKWSQGAGGNAAEKAGKQAAEKTL